MSHDQNFKNLILDYPRQALQFFAPNEAKDIDAGARITPIRQEQLKNRLGDRFHELDTPLMVEWPDGRRGALLFVVEQETEPRRFSIHRLAHYCLELSELCGTDRVVPVVIFLHEGNYARKLALGGDQEEYLRFHYLICDLPRLPAARFRDSDNIVARLNLPNMDHERSQRIDVYADAVKGLLTLETDYEKQRKYIDFIDIYASLDDNEIEQYQQQHLKEVEAMSGLAQALMRKGEEIGVERGLQQGVRQGMRQGEASLLMRLLHRKFGPLSERQRQRIEAADSETLLQWGERILTAGSVDEVISE